MAIMRAAASPAAGGSAGSYSPPRHRGSAAMAWRWASESPMAQAEWRAELAMGTMLSTISGYSSAHSSVCMPPSDPPTTARTRRTPSARTTSAWTRTMSRRVTAGNLPR